LKSFDYEITKCRIFSWSYNGFLPRQLPRHLTSAVCPLTDHSTNGVAMTDFCEISHISLAYFVCVFFFYILTEDIHLSKPFLFLSAIYLKHLPIYFRFHFQWSSPILVTAKFCTFHRTFHPTFHPSDLSV